MMQTNALPLKVSYLLFLLLIYFCLGLIFLLDAADLLKDVNVILNEFKKAPKGSWKVVVRTAEEDNDNDSDSDGTISPRGRAPSEAQPITPKPDERAREDQIRLEVEKQVQARLAEEEEKLKRVLKDKYTQKAPSGSAVAEINAKEVILVTPIGKG